MDLQNLQLENFQSVSPPFIGSLWLQKRLKSTRIQKSLNFLTG